jgi:hypothetical protein
MEIDVRRLMLAAGSVIVFAYTVAAAVTILFAFGRPAQPLPLGTVQWFYEVGATVDRVDRVSQIGTGAHALHAHGEFYIVHARLLASFGLRPVWHDGDVEVRTFAGSGGTMRDLRFTVDRQAQSFLDRQTGRPGSVHLVRGAEQREDLVFDLPRNIEQPALLFLPANDRAALLDLFFGSFWQPHRFNLRYD